MKGFFAVAVAIGLCASGAAVCFSQTNVRPGEQWVATWAAAQEMAPTTPDRPIIPPDIKRPEFRKMTGPRPSQTVPTINENQTVRMVVHTSIGGKRFRVELSNAFGKGVVSLGEAHVALRTSGSSIDVGSDRRLTFSGSKAVDLRPGVVLVSDPVDLQFNSMSDLAISLFVVKAEGAPTNHTIGLHTAYISEGNATASASLADAATTTTYPWLRSVDVSASIGDFAIVSLGDSITDGFGTSNDKNQAWPTLLAARFAARKTGPRVAVLNEGISGNEVLHDGAGVSALARMDRDVLSQPGVRWIVLFEGINDINIHGQITGPGALTADDLIRGYQQVIARAHMHKVQVIGATLTPEQGVWLAGPVGEATRQTVNRWIRSSGSFDAVVDFDIVVRDRTNPQKLREDFDPGDHIHPNDVGNAAMANAFDLTRLMR